MLRRNAHTTAVLAVELVEAWAETRLRKARAMIGMTIATTIKYGKASGGWNATRLIL